MKKLLFVVFSLVSIFIFSQDADEKEIYSVVINSIPEENIKIINEFRRTRFEDMPDEKEEYNFLMKGFLFLRKSTIKNFILNNKVKTTVNNDFKTNKKVMIGDFKYSESILLSNIGFDYSKTQALVQYHKDDIFLALFEKNEGKWLLKEKKKLKNLWSEYFNEQIN